MRARRPAPLTLVLIAATCAACANPGGSSGPASSSPAASVASTNTATPTTEEEKAIYAMGVALSKQVLSLHLSPAELELLTAGLADGVNGRPHKAEPADYADRLGKLADTRSAAAAVDEKKTGSAFLDKLAAEPGAKRFPTGLVFTSVKEGTGASPLLNQSVRVHYRGTLADGTVVDSSDREAEPTTAPMARVIPCWSQALQLMKEGGKARIGCPSTLAYGDRGLAPAIPPGAALAFDVELVEVVR